MNLTEQIPKSQLDDNQTQPDNNDEDQSLKNIEVDECIESLLESSKVYRNTGKIITKFLSKRDRVKKLLMLFDDVLKEELAYISTLLHKFNKNIKFDKFKEEAVNNLYIFKENLKLVTNLLWDEKFEHINNQINTDRYPLINLYSKQNIKNSTHKLKASLMECIKEENEDVAENHSYHERKSKSTIEALDTIKRSHIEISEYVNNMDRTMVSREFKSPKNEFHKSKESIFHVKEHKRLNRSSDRIGRKDTSVPKSKQIRNAKNIIMSVQYFTNSVKQRFKMTPKPKKKEPASIVFKPTEKQQS